MTEVRNKNLLEWLAEYWFLVFFLGGMAVTWGSFTTRINGIEAKTIVLENRLQEASNGLNDVKGGIIRIETSLQFIKEQITNK